MQTSIIMSLTIRKSSSQGPNVADILEGFIFTATKPPPSLVFDQHIAATLPSRSFGLTLLNAYLDHINWVYYIIQ